MSQDSALFSAVVARMEGLGRRPSEPITLSTELYRDLSIYGHDLAELVQWANQEYGVPITINIHDFAPREIPFFRLIGAARRLLGMREPHYRSLTVEDVVNAIEKKEWFAM